MLLNRMLARMFDIILFMILFLIVAFTTNYNPKFLQMILLFCFLIYNILSLSIYGTTIGKKVLRLKIIDREGDNLSFIQICSREVLVFIILYSNKLMEYLNIYLGILNIPDYISLILSLAILFLDFIPKILKKSNSLLHDIIVKSEVVEMK